MFRSRRGVLSLRLDVFELMMEPVWTQAARNTKSVPKTRRLAQQLVVRKAWRDF